MYRSAGAELGCRIVRKAHGSAVLPMCPSPKGEFESRTASCSVLRAHTRGGFAPAPSEQARPALAMHVLLPEAPVASSTVAAARSDFRRLIVDRRDRHSRGMGGRATPAGPRGEPPRRGAAGAGERVPHADLRPGGLRLDPRPAGRGVGARPGVSRRPLPHPRTAGLFAVGDRELRVRAETAAVCHVARGICRRRGAARRGDLARDRTARSPRAADDGRVSARARRSDSPAAAGNARALDARRDALGRRPRAAHDRNARQRADADRDGDAAAAHRRDGRRDRHHRHHRCAHG